MRRALATLAAAVLPVAVAGGGVPWYLVDAPLVVCPGSAHEVQIRIPLDGIPESERKDPHILTFFRTSTEAVTLALNLTDSSSPENKTLEAESVALKDLAGSSRRLAGADRVSLAVGGGARARRLHGGFSSRRRSISSPASQQSAQPSVPAAPAHGAAGAQGAVYGGAPHSPYSGAPHAPPGGAAYGGAPHAAPGGAAYGGAPQAWGTPHGAAGSYGYPNAAAQNQAFGGHPPAQTSYGYSGAGAWGAGRGANIAMAAGAGALGAVGGAMAYNHLHSWYQSLHETCWADGVKYDTCSECKRSHSPASDCEAKYVPPKDLARDDIMSKAFVPADVTGPLTLTITAITGDAYTASKICPPVNESSSSDATANETSNDGDNSSGTDTATAGSDAAEDGNGRRLSEAGQLPFIFVTLTSQSRANDSDTPSGAASATEQESDPEAKRKHVIRTVFLGVVAACCCCCCVAAGMHVMRQQEDKLPLDSPYPATNMPPTQYPPSQYAQYPPQQYAGGFPAQCQPQYGQPHYGQQFQQYISQGQPVPQAAPGYRPGAW